MVSLSFVDQIYSEKLIKLSRETKMAKRAIRKMHGKMVDSEQKSRLLIEQLKRENISLRKSLAKQNQQQKPA